MVSQVAQAVFVLHGQFDDKLAHTFERDNFGILKGRVVLVDYGAPALAEIASAYPDELATIFRNATTTYAEAIS